MRAALAEREQGKAERVAPLIAQPAPAAIADVFDETTGEWVPASHAPRPRWACR
jgi:hypothetical protein